MPPTYGLQCLPLVKTAMNAPFVNRFGSPGFAFCLALALSLFTPGLLHSAPPTQILVLHSYSQEYPWTRRQHEGFMQALSEDAQVNATVSTEYLDTKRRAYNETYSTEFANHLQMKYAGYKPVAIYVTDDDALLFARDYLSGIFPGTPVFFSGVNDYSVLKSLPSALFTGVFERQEVAPNIDWLLLMDKDANDLVFIGDGSNTYRAIESEVLNDLIPYHLRTTFISEKRLDRAVARLHDLPGKYLFLTTVGGMTDANGQVLPLHDILKSLAQEGRIILSMEDTYILEGVLGGYVTSGQKHGMNAARLLLAYLHGKPIIDLPPMLKSPNALILDDRVLQQYGINLPESLLAQAILLNPRPGFYERYHSLILGSLIVLAALLFLVVTGSLVIMSRKNRELGLAHKSAETANILFNQLAKQSRTVHWEVNAEGLYSHVSPVSYAVLGYRPEEIVGKKHFYDLLSDEGLNASKTAVFESFAKQEPFYDLENTLRTKDGRLIWVLTNGIPVRDDRGTFLGYRGSDSDITERKQTEEEIAHTLSILVSTMESTDDGIMVADGKGGIVLFNGKFKNMWGIPEAIIASKDDDAALDFVLDQLKEPELFLKTVRALYGAPEEISFDVLELKDGRVFERYSQPQRNGDSVTGRVWSFRDITERKQAEQEREKLEAQLLQSQKMEAIGQLAGGVAHDFNNILCAITGFGSLLKMRLKENDKGTQYVAEILQAADRAAALTQSLLAFSRKQHINLQPMDLNVTIQKIEKILTRTIGEDIHLSLHLTEQNTSVYADSNQITQILINLAANARDAMPKGGAMTIGTARAFIDEAIMKVHGYGSSGEYVVMTFEDSGMGMDATTRKRVFEPFFTTKEVGKGTGLGLSMVYGIVKQHNGFIDVYSEINAGTVFNVYLPALEMRVETQESDEHFKHADATETILVVEDDSMVRRALTKMMQEFGYTVIEACDGDQAVTKFLEHKDEIHLVLMDVIMPRKSGEDAYQELMAIQPDLKIILMSGYTGDYLSGKLTMAEDVNFISKPVPPKELFEKIRSVLRGGTT